MSATARLAAFAAMLIAALGAGAGLGAAVGPDPTDPREVSVDTGGDACDPAEDVDMDHGSP